MDAYDRVQGRRQFNSFGTPFMETAHACVAERNQSSRLIGLNQQLMWAIIRLTGGCVFES